MNASKQDFNDCCNTQIERLNKPIIEGRPKASEHSPVSTRSRDRHIITIFQDEFTSYCYAYKGRDYLIGASDLKELYIKLGVLL